MSCSESNAIVELPLPDEAIFIVFEYLSVEDLNILFEIGNTRLKDCCKRALENRPFGKQIL